MKTITEETKSTAFQVQNTAGRAELFLKAAHILALESCDSPMNVHHEKDRNEIVRELIETSLSLVLSAYSDAMKLSDTLGYPEASPEWAVDRVQPAPPKLTEPRRRQAAAAAA